MAHLSSHGSCVDVRGRRGGQGLAPTNLKFARTAILDDVMHVLTVVVSWT